MVVQGRKIVKRVSLHQKPQFPPSLKLCVLCVSVVKKSLCPTFADLPSSSDRRRHWDMCGRYRLMRSLVSLRWGLIPSWAKDEKIGYRTINARMETVQTAPAY